VYEPKSEEIININGPERETIFWHAKGWLVAGYEARLQAELDKMWAHYKDLTDDRLLTLVAALCIENSVDAVLQAFSPRFADCLGSSDFTFSLKIEVVRSMRMLPSRILTACDLIRVIRNEFAHHLEVKEFGQLDNEKCLRKLGPYVAAFSIRKRDANDHRGLFTDLVGFVLLALNVYTRQIARLREYLESEGFGAAFKGWADSAK
jgi:hypothetical protein